MLTLASLQTVPAPQPALPRDRRTEQAADLELVRKLALSFMRRMPSHVELAELISLGNIGLCESYARYNPSRGVPFHAFAAMRIRGAMLDGMREEDILSRAERRTLRATLSAEPSARRVGIDGETAELADEAPNGDAQMETQRHWNAVVEALPSLEPRLREVVQLHFLEEQTLRSIGIRLGVTESRACQLIRTALERLRVVIGLAQQVDPQSSLAPCGA